MQIEFVPTMITEWFGKLRFLYVYNDPSCVFIPFHLRGNGTRIHYEPEEGDYNEEKKKLIDIITNIVCKAEERSKHTREQCGAEGVQRTDLNLKTLCDTCYAARIKAQKAVLQKVP